MSVFEINIDAIKNNISCIRKLLKHNQKLCFVVKANAYGFGAKTLCENVDKFVDYFAVSSSKEFFEINKKTTKPILILAPVYCGLKRLISSGAELTISNFESFKKVEQVATCGGINAKIHIAINTGMNRFGFKSKFEINRLIMQIKKSQNISICGVFSHYYQGNNEYFAKIQQNKFCEYKALFDANFKNLTYHISASDGLSFGNYFDMVRVGMEIYSDKQFPTCTLKTKVLDIQKLMPNDIAGYSFSFIAKSQKTIAVVGVGYGDGLPRNIVKNGYVLINKNKAKIIAICMDVLIVDVTDFDVKIFDDVIIIGSDGKNKISICDIATWCDTIGYEIIVHLLSRLNRKYISQGKNICKS